MIYPSGRVGSGRGRAGLPFRFTGQEEPERRGSAAGPADRGEPLQRLPRRILIVEDNQDAAETLKDYLTFDGHQVEVAASGPEGVEAAARFLPDVVLCDIGLPGMDGWEVARRLRENPATANARLIAVTGYGTEEDRRLSAEAGFETHLTKPLDLDTLDRLLARGS